MLQFIDTHCHIHSADYKLSAEEVLYEAVSSGIKNLLCVGTDLRDSQLAIKFVEGRPNCSATIGIHPHEAQHYSHGSKSLQNFCSLVNEPGVVAIGECGLDYFYEHSPKELQEQVLRTQIELALKAELPVIFHVRDKAGSHEVFDDFWHIFDSYKQIRGVVHSFSSNMADLEAILERGLYVGLNGIMTFTKDDKQLEAAKAVPLQKLLLETDAPYLTPVPFRGTICKPVYVRQTAEFLANLRGESLDELSFATTNNAAELFKL